MEQNEQEIYALIENKKNRYDKHLILKKGEVKAGLHQKAMNLEKLL